MTTGTVRSVWIEEGCIVCNACETTCPEVFLVTEETCLIRGEAREDGQQSENRMEKATLLAAFGTDLHDAIEEAAEGCPVEVIKLELA